MASKTSTSPLVLTTLTENDDVPGSKFENDPSDYTVDQLKRWLKCRGLKQSGKREDLLQRVTDCIRSGNYRSLDVSIDGGKWLAAKVLKENAVDQKSKCERQNTADIPVAPLPADWNNFQSKDIPPHYNYGHIYHYALESIKNIAQPDYDGDNGIDHMTDKPLKNARKYVDSGFVHDVTDAKSKDYYFVRAHVWPSMRSELPHNVSVILSNLSGAVIHASCEPCKVSALGRCSHIVAVLMFVLDHAEKHGHTASVACTSQPCTWNKGKKRNKNPQRLSDADYPSKCRKRDGSLIDFDPRPNTHRRVTPHHINGLLLNLQKISTKNSNGVMSMWETQLQMSYDDYSLDKHMTENLQEKTKILKENLIPDKLMEIPGTREQSSSEEWYSQQFRRLTASKCQIACNVGKLVCSEAPEAAVRAHNFIKSNVWKLDNNSVFPTFWMKYGLDSEPKAINKYEEQTNAKVCQTGLWVNPNFPFLGCSPDGLVSDNGLVEIKSLKVFKNDKIEDIISGKVSLPKDTIKRQCFIIKDGKCVLRQKHAYYFQVQMQLLVTERDFCDFILYAEEGEVSIERIYRNESVIAEILSSLTALWHRVLAPEIFEMRVPRGLHPFILPENEPEIGENDVPEVSTDCNPPYTDDEFDVADILVNAIGSPVNTSCSSTRDLVVVPWGGETATGIQLVNTCPLDNWLMVIQALVKSHRIDLADLAETGAIIASALQLIDNKQFGDAKIATLLTQPQVINNCISLYGNEDDYFIKLLRPYLYSKVTSRCTLSTCPKPLDIVNSCTVNLGIPANQRNNVFLSALDGWTEPSICQCKRKFDSKPQLPTPCVEDVMLDVNGCAHESWHCAGVRENSERSLDNLKSFFVFSVDLLSRGGLLTLDQVPLCIVLHGRVYNLYGATLWNGWHYISMFYYNNSWTLYDGLKELQKENSGLSFSKTIFIEPAGYSLSYLIFCI